MTLFDASEGAIPRRFRGDSVDDDAGTFFRALFEEAEGIATVADELLPDIVGNKAELDRGTTLGDVDERTKGYSRQRARH